MMSSEIGMTTTRPTMPNDARPLILKGRSTETFEWAPGDWLSPKELLGNTEMLRAADLYERALLDCYRQAVGPQPIEGVAFFGDLFREADRARLRAAGDPIPPRSTSTRFR